MTKPTHLRSSLLLGLCFLVGPMAACASVKGRTMSNDTAVIDRLAQNIRQVGKVARAPVEKAAGVNLHIVDEDAYFRSYTGGPLVQGELSFTLDLREPKQGATGG